MYSRLKIIPTQKIFDSFIGKLSEKLDKLIIGNPLDDNTDIGTIINNKQFTKVCDYISDGLNNKNTEVICGGLPPEDGPLSEGYFTIPTIFRNKSNEWRLAKEEIFGPVLVAIPWDDEEEVIRMANQSHYGLAAYVWTRDITRGINAAHAIESGWVQVNQGLAQALDIHMVDLNNRVLAVSFHLKVCSIASLKEKY